MTEPTNAERIRELEIQLAEANARADAACQRLSCVPDHWADRYHCLADGHAHPHRWHEALCSADFHLADARVRASQTKAEIARLREAHKLNANMRRLYFDLGHRCEWRILADAMHERSREALEDKQ